MRSAPTPAQTPGRSGKPDTQQSLRAGLRDGICHETVRKSIWTIVETGQVFLIVDRGNVSGQSARKIQSGKCAIAPNESGKITGTVAVVVVVAGHDPFVSTVKAISLA
jgi:hypothetical protein